MLLYLKQNRGHRHDDNEIFVRGQKWLIFPYKNALRNFTDYTYYVRNLHGFY
jgi:hypothetical protein